MSTPHLRPAAFAELLRQRVVYLMAVVALDGCMTTWKPRDVTPAQLLESTGETQVQVRFLNGGRLVLRDPGIEGDSLVGWQVPETHGDSNPPVRRAFPLTDVQQLATRGNNAAPNVILGAATGIAVFLASSVGVYLLVCASGCD